MCVLFSLFHIEGFSFVGGSTSFTRATPKSQTGFAPTSSLPTSRLSTLERQPQTGFSFNTPSSQVTKVTAAKLKTTANGIEVNFEATLSSTPSIGKFSSRFVINLILLLNYDNLFSEK